jgi:hypothetical protein
MPQIGQSPGPSLHDLRMHGAGVLRALRHRLRSRAVTQIIPWRRLELLLAAGGAEIVLFAFVPQEVFCARAVDLHAADGIDSRQISLRLLDELGPAALGAEMIAVAGMVGARLSRIWMDGHAADRVAYDSL